SQQNNQYNGTEKTVILVHGYGKGQADMRPLADFLGKAGYRAVTVDLPLTFDRVEEAAKVFEKEVEAVLSGLPDNESIAMVGHSTGGLVIRYFLSHHPDYKRVDHAVLIATPNQGSTLADMAGEVSDLLVETFATLDSLQPENISELGLADPEETRIGAIAGNKDNLALGRLLEKENDGRVEVESVYYPGLDDFVILPYNHNKIHHSEETASLVISFLKTGSFTGNK
ncbi:MAG: alpha/beta fold hydrolase, partial [Desulfobacteraceae bacterium]|nr:alpha/beta fold hydrolase [Desulfobacteraceae bacterium]